MQIILTFSSADLMSIGYVSTCCREGTLDQGIRVVKGGKLTKNPSANDGSHHNSEVNQAEWIKPFRIHVDLDRAKVILVDGGIGVLTLPISSSSGVRQRSEAFPP
jgi:hypothetical protein